MKRNSANLRKYEKTCEIVFERCDGRCEVMVDKNGKACTRLPKTRCSRFIPYELVQWANFLHTQTRNGKSDDWVLSPKNIVFGCESHHREEEQTGIRVKMFIDNVC